MPCCPVCREPTFSVAECRKSRTSTRRRRRCTSCGHKATTHEVSQEWFHQAENDRRALAAIRAALGVQAPTPAIPCESCALNTGTRCSVDLPEYSTDDAADCSAYHDLRLSAPVESARMRKLPEDVCDS